MLGDLLKLERLSLDSTNVTDTSVNVLLGFGQLKELNLYHTLFTEKVYEQIHSALPKCKIVWDPLSSDSKRRRS